MEGSEVITTEIETLLCALSIIGVEKRFKFNGGKKCVEPLLAAGICCKYLLESLFFVSLFLQSFFFRTASLTQLSVNLRDC